MAWGLQPPAVQPGETPNETRPRTLGWGWCEGEISVDDKVHVEGYLSYDRYEQTWWEELEGECKEGDDECLGKEAER